MTITPLVLAGGPESDIPSLVTVHPVAVAAILDHHLRRPRDADGREQDRVIGTLMGTRSENGDVHVLSSFGVPFGEVGEEDDRKLLLDTESLKQQVEIVLKASSKLAVVGWYATNPALNKWTPLIHDEYAEQASASAPQAGPMSISTASTAPIHMTLDVDTLQIAAYASTKYGLAPESTNRTFVPLQTEMRTATAEQTGLELLSKHALPTQRNDNAASSSASSQQLVAPLVSLNGMLQEVSNMLDAVIGYVRQVTEGSVKGDARIGRQLLDTLGSIPLPSASSKASFEEDFSSHLADLLMVSYLANVVRVNLEIASRASMLHDARLGPRSAI